VDVIHDGRSFSKRNVRVVQDKRLIMQLMVSFQKSEYKGLRHQKPAPNIKEPGITKHKNLDDIYHEILASSEASENSSPHSALLWIRENGLSFIRSISKEHASRLIDYHYVSPDEAGRAVTGDPTDYRQYVWFRPREALYKSPKFPWLALAYATDHDLINSSILAHERSSRTSNIETMCSLDHIMYFHEVFRPNQCFPNQHRRLKRATGCYMKQTLLGQVTPGV